MVADHFEDYNLGIDSICKRSESKLTVKNNGKKWKIKTPKDK